MGKHSSAVTRSNKSNNNRRPVYITAVGLLVLSIGGVFVVRSFGSESGSDGILGGKSCDDPTQIKLTTAPELQPAIETAAKSLSAKGGKDGVPCLQFTITGTPAAKVARSLATGADDRPDIWIPDSSLWVSQADDGETVPSVAVPSVASSPMVLVGRNTNFADTSSWLRALGGAQPALLDPLGTSPGALTLLAIQAERQQTSTSNTTVNNVVVPLAQRLGSMPKPFTDVNALFGRASQEGSDVIVPASEQAFVKYQEEHPEGELKAVMPATGTLSLDYPVVVTAKGDTAKATEAAKTLGGEMIGDAAGQARDQAGFRDQLLGQLSGGRGVGEINQLPKPNADSIDRTLGTWSRLSLSTHSLAVIDVSGSMAEKVGNKTRMQLTIEAASGGLSLFPDSASLGLWTFSSNVGKDGADYNKLVPIAPLSPKQRNTIGNVLKQQKPIPNGGTGLYQTAIAAVRAVRSNYDPNAVNSILLFTDGKNDDPGSSDLDATIRSLQSLNDPDRPVRIIALGMGPDVNANELSRLAQATGGRSYVADNPSDLRQVFIDALQSR
ncbi:substrate-binding and VWA domain-containing protein [Kribbella sp. NPDC056951]|uniref:Substrate-binding domain-containing protein n=1 Tax=Kribbella yunnanensis TaxID=190194 RepID=A0ABP4VCL0_9ACTN